MIQSVETLALLVNGTICGDRLREIHDAAAIETANSTAITFVVDVNQARRLKDCRAGMMLLTQRLSLVFFLVTLWAANPCRALASSIAIWGSTNSLVLPALTNVVAIAVAGLSNLTMRQMS